MERTKVGSCPKCGGHSQFYHKCGDVTIGYCLCEVCGYRQKGLRAREEAVAEWNKGVQKKRIWDNFEEIGEVRKSDGIKFIVAAATRDGYRYINIREFYLRKKDSVWRPGRDGITIPIKAPLDKGTDSLKFITPLTDMLDVLQNAFVRADTMELMDESKTVYIEQKIKEQK